MKRIFALVLVLALTVTVFSGCGGGGGGSRKSYDSALRTYTKVLDGTLTEKDMERMYPQEYWDYLAENEGMTRQALWEQLEPLLGIIWLMLDNTYGEGYRVTYKVTDEEPLDEEDDRWQENMGYGLDPEKVSKAYAIEVEYTIRGSKKETTVEGDGFAFRYNGAWYAILTMDDMSDVLGMSESEFGVPQDTPAELKPATAAVPTETQCEELLDCYFLLITGKGEAEDMIRLFPDDTWEYVEDELDMDLEDVERGFMDQADEVAELLEDTFGRRVKITYELGDIEPYDAQELEDLQDECDSVGLKARKLTAACDVEVELTVKGAEDQETYDTQAIFYRYDGQWYLKEVDLEALHDDIGY